MADNTEILFWKVIKNKYLFYHIISFTNIRFRTIKYKLFNDISQIINSNSISLLIEKLNRGEFLNFKNYNNFDCIFKKIKNVNEENIKLYKKLIPNYSMVDFKKLLESSIENDCLVGFLVLINKNNNHAFNETNNINYNNKNYYFDYNCIIVNNNYQFYFNEALKNNSLDILTYLCENDEYNNFPCSIKWKNLLSNKIHNSIIIRMLTKVPRLISLIERNDLIFFEDSIFPEDILNIDLEILISLCIIIINIPFLKEIKSSSSPPPPILTINEINEIKNKYSEQDLKSNIINLGYDDLNLKKLIKFYYYSIEFDIDYSPYRFLKFDDDDDSNEEINSHTNRIHKKLMMTYNQDGLLKPSLEYCNSRLLEKAVNEKIGKFSIFENRLYPQVLFKFMKSSQDSKSRYKTFISKVILKNLFNPIVLLFLLIEYDDIELIDFLISIPINHNQTPFNTSVNPNLNFFKDNYLKMVSMQFNNIEKFDFNIKKYIRSNEMLEFCFTNFNEIILHSKFKNNLKTWVEMGRIDLIENFNQLIANQLKDKYNIENDIILPTFINSGFSTNITSIPKGYGLISYAYLIKKLLEISKIVTYKNFNFSKYLDEKILLKSLVLKVNSKINLDYQLECIKLIIENTTEQFNPLSIMVQTEIDIEFLNGIQNDLFILKASYINKQFLNWLFTNRKSADIDSGRCIFSTCQSKVSIPSRLSLISALYLSNQIDQFLIEFENHLINESYFQLDIIFEDIGKNNDYQLLEKLLNGFNNFETKTQPSLLPKTFNEQKKRLLSLCLFRASVEGNIMIFKFLLENYDNILFPKNSNLPENNYLETDESFQRYVAKAIEKDNHQLFEFFFQNLGYQSIISELEYSSNLFFAIHEDFNHLFK
ncbi:hypothetical protein ACTFIZ_001898 [Dictyostelium cf. discoideum]